MTGPMYLTNPCNNTLMPINLADIPISVNLFTAWFMNNIVRRQTNTYLLRSFIDDVLGTLLPPALGEGCVEGAGRSLVRVQSNVIAVKGVHRVNPPFRKGTVVNANQIMEKMQNFNIVYTPTGVVID